ncbi:16S rRNA processing protein RimM [Puteibacter caeruleilacunae]|nr:16S rRNA processing protein RimM [Puteibacter caeruleilacunae]
MTDRFFIFVPMETINRQECIYIGKILKTHGIHGELTLTTEEGIIDLIEDPDHLFLEIDQLLVPFFFSDENFRIRSANSLTIGFDDIPSQEKANEYKGCPVYISRQFINQQTDETNPNLLIGYELIDTQVGSIGIIEDLHDFSGNMILSVNRDNQEVMVPLTEEFIEAIDQDKKQLIMNCPEGLFDLED